MRDLAPTLKQWLSEGHLFALATVVSTSGSSPRGAGSVMAVRDDGLIAGSVSGGCVEGAVVAAALRSLTSGRPEMLEFGAASEAALFEVGLSCGGEIEVWVEPVGSEAPLLRVLDRFGERAESLRVTKLSPERSKSCFYFGEEITGNPFFENLGERQSGIVEMGECLYFVEHRAVPDRLVIVGAVHIAVALASFAKDLGFEVVVIDPREAFAKPERFASAPVMMTKWPDKALAELGLDASTYVVSLSHDSKIDDPAVFAAIRGGAAFVGALGGRKTQAKRRETLKAMGLSEAELDRIVGPVGLDIGAQTPEEIALSIVAQIVRVKRAPR